ncbi:MAG: hypothetical protein HZB43_09735 [candidate division Zixibacteria bacterium]|nr:hypothetical protein [candidate division Zixibacteria bacterium]
MTQKLRAASPTGGWSAKVRWSGILSAFVLALIVSGPVARAGPADSTPVPLILESRLITGPDQCPKAVQVWLVSTPDTIQGFEIFVTWDRPDFAKFAVAKRTDSLPGDRKGKSGAKDSKLNPGSTPLRPQISRAEGLVAKWEFFEARGDSGLSVKVVGLAYFLGDTRPRPIAPGDSGVLFSLPLEMAGSKVAYIDGDSSIVRLDNMMTRFSDAKGNLIKEVVLRDAIAHVAPCRPTVKKK